MHASLHSSLAIGLMAASPLFALQASIDTHMGRPIMPTRVAPDGSVAPAYATDAVLVRFGAGVDDARERAAVLGSDFVAERVVAEQIDLWFVPLPAGLSVDDAMTALGARDGVLYAVPDHVVTNRDTFPNDSLFGTQYGKHNTGQTGGTNDADIDAPAAWDIGTGSADFAIAVVDGGTDHGHPDLVGNRWQNDAELNGQPGVDDDGNGYVDDRYGWNAYNNNGSVGTSSHGTHVTGIAAAQGNNGIGIAGVSWDSEFVSIAGSSGFTSTVVTAYSYALALKDQWIATNGAAGARIVAVNSSFGVDFANCNAGQYAPWNDMMDTMGQSGILSIGATANQGTNVDAQGDVPTGCSSDYLISVTATDDRDRRNFSAYGLTTIDLGAPGESIRSTLPGNSYGNNTGTSMATPQVTGAIALLHSVAGNNFAGLRDANPAMAALEIKRILLETVDVVPTLDGFTVSGGRMNVEAAAAELANYGTGGFNYCNDARPNSTGAASHIEFDGSNDVALNDFTLIATDLPPVSTSLFLVSADQGFVANPAGSAGNLCLSGEIGRFVNGIGLSSGGGRFENVVDLTQIPHPSQGLIGVVPGQTLNFQCWHRDSLLGFPTSNFSNGLSVIFE